MQSSVGTISTPALPFVVLVADFLPPATAALLAAITTGIACTFSGHESSLMQFSPLLSRRRLHNNAINRSCRRCCFHIPNPFTGNPVIASVMRGYRRDCDTSKFRRSATPLLRLSSSYRFSHQRQLRDPRFHRRSVARFFLLPLIAIRGIGNLPLPLLHPVPCSLLVVAQTPRITKR